MTFISDPHSKEDVRQSSNSTILRGALVVDATGRPATVRDVTVVGDRITAVTPHDAQVAAAQGPDLTEIDLRGHTLMPGLIDAHTHLGLLVLQGQSTLPLPRQAALVFANLAACLDHGFTTVRDLGGIDGALADTITDGLVSGPLILPSAAILSQSGGHGDYRSPHDHHPFNSSFGADGFIHPPRLCDGPDEVRRAAREQIKRGATQLKLFLSGGLLSEGDPVEMPQYSVAEIRAAVAEARDRGLGVTGHAHAVAGIMRGLECGVRSFEHGTFIDRPTAELLRESDSVVVPTLSVLYAAQTGAASMGIPEHLVRAAGPLLDKALEAVAMMSEMGVRMGSGSDLIGTDQSTRGSEIRYKAAVIGDLGAIESATRINAELIGLDREIGTVEAGKRADLVAFQGDSATVVAELGLTPATLVMQAGHIVRDRRPDECWNGTDNG